MKKKFAFSNRLIFDLGMNNGDDAEYYLKRNFKVLAIEANPDLCDFVNFRFQQAIKSNNLEIVNAAIAMECGHAKFFVNLANDHWSSMDPVWAGRDGTLFKEITVNTFANFVPEWEFSEAIFRKGAGNYEFNNKKTYERFSS